LANAYAINLVFKYTSLQKKFNEIRLQGNLCFPVRYISLIKKKALQICSMVPVFFKVYKTLFALIYFLTRVLINRIRSLKTHFTGKFSLLQIYENLWCIAKLQAGVKSKKKKQLPRRYQRYLSKSWSSTAKFAKPYSFTDFKTLTWSY